MSLFSAVMWLSHSLHIKDDTITYVASAWAVDISICIYGDSSKWVQQEIISGEKVCTELYTTQY